MKFDWSHHSASKIQWAAFYSDCGHQFQPIKSGYQVILVYRMYVTEPIGSSIVHHDPIIDPQSLPMYNYIKELVEQPAFFRESELNIVKYHPPLLCCNFHWSADLIFFFLLLVGAMAIYCAHAYPHNTPHAKELLPRALKGSDMAIWAVYKALGLLIGNLPVIYNHGYDADVDDDSPLIGDELHSIIDVNFHDIRSSIRRLIESNWPCTSTDDCMVWVNDPLHTNPALKINTRSWRNKIMTLDSALAIIVGLPAWVDRVSNNGESLNVGC